MQILMEIKTMISQKITKKERTLAVLIKKVKTNREVETKVHIIFNNKRLIKMRKKTNF